VVESSDPSHSSTIRDRAVERRRSLATPLGEDT
jgi:hypothetical protein